MRERRRGTCVAGGLALLALLGPSGCGAVDDGEASGWSAEGPLLWTAGESLEVSNVAALMCERRERERTAGTTPRDGHAARVADKVLQRAVRCGFGARRFTLESVTPGSTCVFGGVVLRLGHDHDGDGAVAQDEADGLRTFCSAHADLQVLPAFPAPTSGAAARLRLPLPVGLDLDGDGSLRASEVALLGPLELALPDAGSDEALGATSRDRRRWLAPCQKQKLSGNSPYRRCTESASNVVALERVTDLGRVQHADDIETVRGDLVTFIFGDDGMPTRLPNGMTPAIEDQRWHDELPAMERVERLEVTLTDDLYSVSYLFFPTTPNGELFLYHEGHNGGFWLGRETIGFLLERGYAVLSLSMPLRGYNPRPGTGTGWWNHRYLWREAPTTGSPIRYFVEPMIVGLNHALALHDFSRVHTVGISGGGWSVTLLAALDPRVSTTFAVAGSLPLFARRPKGAEWGDREQSFRPLYHRASYLDLYALGAVGEGRRFFQVANEGDDCCFRGHRHGAYVNDVTALADALGGRFTFWVDEGQTTHAISPDAHVFVEQALASLALPTPGGARLQ